MNVRACARMYVYACMHAFICMQSKRDNRMHLSNIPMCTTHATVPYGNVGCNGGDIIKAMKYVVASGGISTETSYPYIEHVSPNKVEVP